MIAVEAVPARDLRPGDQVLRGGDWLPVRAVLDSWGVVYVNGGDPDVVVLNHGETVTIRRRETK